jgi:hypothetical protein
MNSERRNLQVSLRPVLSALQTGVRCTAVDVLAEETMCDYRDYAAISSNFPLYLQSLPVHSANVAKPCTKACRRVLTSTLLYLTRRQPGL